MESPMLQWIIGESNAVSLACRYGTAHSKPRQQRGTTAAGVHDMTSEAKRHAFQSPVSSRMLGTEGVNDTEAPWVHV
jgi:hypothetical protein